MVVQPGLCLTWSETPKTGFLSTWLRLTSADFYLSTYMIKSGQPMVGVENDDLRIMGTVKCLILYAFTL